MSIYLIKLWEGLAPGKHRYLHNFGATPKLWEGACSRWRPQGRSGCWVRPSTYPLFG
ncbi:hypothetical protein [Pseudomonas synxantha]|nr:hypothetical protein [Pseudomonas synxantha]